MTSALMGKKTSTVTGIVVISLLFGLPLFSELDSDDLHNDEAVYSYTVDRVLEHGNWLWLDYIPAGDVEPVVYTKQPSLKLWIVALGIKLGLLPHNEFGFRFWDALFGAITFVYVFLIGRRLVDSVCGFAAVFLLFTHPLLLFDHGLRSNVMEAALVLAYSGGIYHFLAWSDSSLSSNRWRDILAAVGWFTFAFLTKGIAAIFLPTIIIVAALSFAEWRGRLRADARRWAGGSLGALLLIAPWFVVQHSLHGSDFWQDFVGLNIYDRFLGDYVPDHHKAWSYYFDALQEQLRTHAALAWVIGGALLWLVESFRRRWCGGFLILLWYLLPIGIISIPAAKLYHYSYPFLPAVALVGAYPVALLVRLARGHRLGAFWGDAPVTRAWWEHTKAFVSRLSAWRAVRACLLVGLTGSVVVVSASLWGETRLELGGVLLFPVASFGLPAIVGVVCLAGLLPARYVVPFFAGACALYTWPVHQYAATLERFDVHPRPLGDVRDCVLQHYATLTAAEPGRVSRVYVHLPGAEGLTNNYYYYYSALDEWERLDPPSDPDLFTRLFVPGREALTIIFQEDYAVFLDRIGTSALSEELRDMAAVRQDPTLIGDNHRRLLRDALPGAVRVGGNGTSPVILLLPGPMASCADVGISAGAAPLVVPAAPGPWRAAYYANAELAGEPTVVVTNATIDFAWGEGAPRGDIPRNDFSVRWDTCLRVDEPVRAAFVLGSDDGAYLLVDDRTIIDNGGNHIFVTKTGEVELAPGVHHLKVRYSESSGGAGVRLTGDGGLLAPERLALPTNDRASPCDPADGAHDAPPVGSIATLGS